MFCLILDGGINYYFGLMVWITVVLILQHGLVGR